MTHAEWRCPSTSWVHLATMHTFKFGSLHTGMQSVSLQQKIDDRCSARTRACVWGGGGGGEERASKSTCDAQVVNA